MGTLSLDLEGEMVEGGRKLKVESPRESTQFPTLVEIDEHPTPRLAETERFF